ncbi:uncharacterized protein LOC112043404 [Bicyclus anynana]|uniref:Uncharacterized protein LOC112043404 n=1 Tax=Bicyclus anynana TaxID=110368 RepID=A0A6J1MNX7_BICAN|nr:uncharacterized protein LOC112043404 [Bicyclus anynana]
MPKYKSKIRKIESQEKVRRRIISPIDSSSDEDDTGPNQSCRDSNSKSPEITSGYIQEARLVPANPNQNQDLDAPSLREVAAANATPDLDPEIIAALGDSTSDAPDYGENIHDNLAKLWLPLLKKGIHKDIKDKLLKDYLAPDNCILLQAPKLNAEISAAVPDMVRSRDKILFMSQQQLGSGITAINMGMQSLLQSDDKVKDLKHLSDACQLLCDSHHGSSQSRIKLLSSSLDKSILQIVNESERDETLFGTTLSEKIKAAKAIEKQGLSIKKRAKSPKLTARAQTSRTDRPSTSYQGNWHAPPRYQANRGGRGVYRRPTVLSARRPYTTPAQPPQRTAALDKPRVLAQSRH